MRIEYQIVPHKGDWAVSIDGKVYDSVEKFEVSFPRELHEKTVFACEFEFSWLDIVDDIQLQWGAAG